MHAIHVNNYLSTKLLDGTRFTAPITSFLEAGCGFGGSCLPKDLRALIAEGRRPALPSRLRGAPLETTEERPDEVLRLLAEALGDVRGRRVAVLGVAFKPDTDD